MPVVKFKPERLLDATGLDSLEEVGEALFRLKCEVEETDDMVEVEVNPDRPDMYSLEGIARAVKGLLGVERGWAKPPLKSSGIVLNAAPVPSRPYIAAAVVYNYRLDEDTLEELIQFQEKLHDTIGRRRRKIAIGIHDLAKLPSPRIEYRELGLETLMKPLGLDVEVPASWVLENTDQGLKYGNTSLREGKHPFLLSGDVVIAMPPVINSNVTRLEPGVRDLFIDVTGTDPTAVSKVLDILVSTLAYRGGVEVGVVQISGMPWDRTPLLESTQYKLDASRVNKVLGTSLAPGDVADALARMRHNTEDLGGMVSVEVPPFRADILGEIDLVEDVAIAVGYEELGPRMPHFQTRGRLLPETLLSRKLRLLLVGLGFTEVLQLTLASPRAPGSSGWIRVANPVQEEYSVLRGSLLPGLLSVARANLHRDKPVKFFEIGHVVNVVEGRVVDELRLGMAVMDYEASYEDIQAPVYSLLRLLGVEFNVESIEHPLLIPGRTALITVEGVKLGWMGEVKPEVLEEAGIDYPVVAAEISVDRLSSRIQGRSIL